MEKRIVIDGKSFDLADSEEKKAAINAWLRSKSTRGASGQFPEDMDHDHLDEGKGYSIQQNEL